MSLIKRKIPRKYLSDAEKMRAYRQRKRVLAGFLKAIRESKTEAAGLDDDPRPLLPVPMDPRGGLEKGRKSSGMVSAEHAVPTEMAEKRRTEVSA